MQRVFKKVLPAIGVIALISTIALGQTGVLKPKTISAGKSIKSPAKRAAADSMLPGDTMLELNFPEQVDIEVLIDFVGKRLKRNFMYLGKVKGKKITLKSNRKIPLSKLQPLLASALAMNDMAMIHDGMYIKVIEKSELKNYPFPIRKRKDINELSPSDNIIQIEIPLKYARASNVKKILGDFATLGKGAAANIVAIDASNTLIITDYTNNLDRLLHIIELTDVGTDIPVLDFVELKNAKVEKINSKLAALIVKMFPATAGKGESAISGPLVTVDYDERRNILILFGLRQHIESLKPIIAEMDKPMPGLEMVVETYYVNNQEVGVVATALSEILGVASPPSSKGGLGAASSPEAAKSSADQVAVAGGKGTDVTIIQNEAANAIYVVATAERQKQVAEYIIELDRRMPQVLIEIYFVSVGKDSAYDVGVELANKGLNAQDGAAGFTFFGLTANDFTKQTRVIGVGAQGINGLFFDNGNIESIVRMFIGKTDGRVLSNPILLANHNKEANFSSVEEAPYTSVNASDTVATTSFADYEEAGTKLTITPYTTLGENSDFLRLDINIEVSTFTDVSLDPTVPPPKQTNILEIKSVVVPNNCTIILGGLDTTSVIDTESKVPILGDIPILGFLFKRNHIVTDKNKLYVFMRPRLVKSEDFRDLKEVSDSKQKERERAEEELKKAHEKEKIMNYKKSLNLK